MSGHYDACDRENRRAMIDITSPIVPVSSSDGVTSIIYRAECPWL